MLIPLTEGNVVTGYLCPDHGYTGHDGIVWVWHERKESG